MAATGVNVADSVISQFNDMKLGRIKVIINNDKMIMIQNYYYYYYNIRLNILFMKFRSLVLRLKR
jgi:hypothetical protein